LDENFSTLLTACSLGQGQDEGGFSAPIVPSKAPSPLSAVFAKCGKDPIERLDDEVGGNIAGRRLRVVEIQLDLNRLPETGIDSHQVGDPCRSSDRAAGLCFGFGWHRLHAGKMELRSASAVGRRRRRTPRWLRDSMSSNSLGKSLTRSDRIL